VVMPWRIRSGLVRSIEHGTVKVWIKREVQCQLARARVMESNGEGEGSGGSGARER